MNIWGKLRRIMGIVGRTARRRKMRVLFVGLNNAGKSTLLNRLKSDHERLSKKMMTPTVGFTTDKFVFNNVKFMATDMSGRDGYRSMWDTMYGQCDAIVFVVDSSDRMRFAVVKDELGMLLQHPDVAGRPEMPILFVANKTTEPDACCASTVAGALQLHEHVGSDRPWRLTGADAYNVAPGHPADDGLREAMEWLTELMRTTGNHHPR